MNRGYGLEATQAARLLVQERISALNPEHAFAFQLLGGDVNVLKGVLTSQH